MQTLEPPWKIRARPCPFFSEGKCIFSTHCNFLHDIKNEPTVIRVTAPDDDDHNKIPNPATILAQQESMSASPQILSPDYNEDYFDDDSPEEDESDLDSPTIRKPVLSLITNKGDSPTAEIGPSRDSVTTVKGETHGLHSTSRVSEPHPSLPNFNAPTRQANLTRPSRSSSTSSRKGPVRDIKLLPSFPESPIGGPVLAPSSASSATAQELEFSGSSHLPIPSNFSLGDATSSSLLANRLAKSRGNQQSSPPVPVEPAPDEPGTPFSAGALYGSYQEDDVSADFLSTDTHREIRPHDLVSPIPRVATKPPSWLRPLRLSSTLTSQTDSHSSIWSNSTSRQFIHNASGFESLSSLSTHFSVSPKPLYDSSVIRESPDELYERPLNPSNVIPTDTPHTIVLSDPDGSVSPFSLSRNGSINIDTSQFPPHPASPESSAHRSSSSQASNSLSELTGRSPRQLPVLQRTRTIPSTDSGEGSPHGRTTTPAEQFRSALERRVKRMRESSRLISSSELQNGVIASRSTSVASLSDFVPFQSFSSLPHINTLSHSESLPTSLSDSLLLQQMQSSPPRTYHHLRASPSVSSAKSPPPHSSAQIIHTLPPDPSPRPHLFFAIASDEPDEVERLLSSGEVSANETAGTGTSLLEFTLANDGLKNKTEIVKILLKYGADPGPLNDMATCDNVERCNEDVYQSPVLAKKLEDAMNPALRYYLTRPQSLDIDSKPILEALQNSSFAPLVKAKFDIIGQDRALDEFYRALGMHSQRKGKNALVILLCGASGHGKSLLAQRVGSLLDAPTHTINMTALRSQQDLWQCLSTGVHDASPDLTLSEFLVENQGKRCVVVLDEIEKVDDPKSLHPLLLPWDIGRYSLEQKRHTDMSKVIWIATSNLGQRLITEHVTVWDHPDLPPTRSEYTQLAAAIRRGIADVLGASLLSRITAILPFLPFTDVEKIAIGTEAVLSHAEFLSAPLSSGEMEALVRRAVKSVDFVEEEGARSLQRAVEIHLSMRT